MYTIKKPTHCTEESYVQLYTQTPDENNVIKMNTGEYICSCGSLYDECSHIKKFKKAEENAGD